MEVNNQNMISPRLFHDVTVLMQSTVKEEIKEEADDLEYQNEEKDYLSSSVEMEQFTFTSSEEKYGDEEEEVMEPLLGVFLQPEEVIDEISDEKEDPLAEGVRSQPVISEDDDDEYCTGTEELVITEKVDICNKSANEVDVQEHTTPQLYSCIICKRRYSEKDYVCDHIRECVGSEAFECLICRESFSSKSACDEHVETHVKKKPYLCTLCNACFTKKTLLQEHSRIHTGGKLFECSICKKCFLYKSWLDRHMQLHEKYKCKICSESFTRKAILDGHLGVHMKKETIECIICEKTFTSKKACKVHMDIHKQECKICHTYYFENNHVCWLMETNTKQSSFQQSICKPQLSLNRHMQMNSGNLYCSICDKKFSSECGFRQHKELHIVKPYNCSVCKELFSQYDMLFLHMSVHWGNKPFTCNTCQKSFLMKENLLKHMLTHTWDKPNECNTCQKSFPDNVNLLRHMLTHVESTPR